MLRVLKKQLLKIVDDIDVGNSEISDEDAIQIADFLKRFNSRDKMISKYQAFTYLNISRAQFDNLVREGRLPEGKKIEGFKELQWSLKEIKDAKRRRDADAPKRKQSDA
jgi:predicted DNA-binding transcriptional regulator AlpA